MAAQDPVQILRERFSAAMRAAFGDALPPNADPLISGSRQPELGDYQSNAAMPLAKALGKNPRQIAQALVAHLDLSGVGEPVSEQNIAGPGFINVRLSGEALAGMLDGLEDHDLGVEKPTRPETVVVDLCGVNLAKQMHVGHLRATVIGDALARTFARLGHTVHRQNHLGDWGLPIAMVTSAIMDGMSKGTIRLDALRLEDLERLYRAAQRACEADEKGLAAVKKYGLGPKALAELEEQVSGAQERMTRAKATLLALQSHEPATLAVWQRIARITLDECLAICARLRANVSDEHTAGESTYAEELAGIVQDLESRGVATISEGALVIDLKDVGINEPLLIRKSDGGFLYATTDLAGIRRRVQKLGGDRVIYAVDARQSLHFRQVFAGAKKAGYTRRPDGSDAPLLHAAFGTILGDDGRPFKTRTGDNVKLADLLDEAVARADGAIAERSPELTPEQRRANAEAIGVAAIKYTDLSSDRSKDYVFNFDRMLAFEGDTGPYLLYALVRIRSILRKAAEQGLLPAKGAARAPLSLGTKEEKDLALTLLRYPGTLQSVADSCEPHRLCNFLHDLAGAFAVFFRERPVLQAETEALRASRLRLCALTGRILEDGLNVLGIPTVDRM